MAKKIFLSEDKKRLEFDEKEYLVKPIDISLEDFNYLIPAYVSIEGILHPYWRTSNDFGKLDTVNNKKADNKKNVNISLDDVLKIDASTDIAQTLNTKYPYTDNYGNIVKSVMGEDSSFSVQSAIGFFSKDVRKKKMARLNASNGFIHTSYNSPTSTAYQNINILSLSQFGESRIIASSNTEDNVPCTIELIFKTSPGLDADILVPTRSGTLALLSDTLNSLLNYYTKTETVTNFVGVQNVQTINETKTFSKSPIVPNATLGSHAVNKNQLDLKVDKNESNEVLQNFDLHQKDGSYISVDVDGLKVSKGGVYTLYKPDSLKPINQVPSAAYQFQEILYPKRSVISVEEKVYATTYVNGVKANENGRADIWGVSNNWTHPQQRYSGLVSKHNDVTYNRLLGMDANGNANEVGLPAMTNEMSKSTDAQKDAWRIAGLKTTETYNIGQPRVDLVNPIITDKTKTYIQYVSLVGLNMFLPNGSNIKVFKNSDDTLYKTIVEIQVLQSNPSIVSFGENFSTWEEGDYYFQIYNGVSAVSSIINKNISLRVAESTENLPIPILTYESSLPEIVITGNSASPITNKIGYIKSNEPILTTTDLSDGVLLEISFSYLGDFFDLYSSRIVVGLVTSEKTINDSVINLGVQTTANSILTSTPDNISNGKRLDGHPLRDVLRNFKLIISIKNGVVVLFCSELNYITTVLYTNKNPLFIKLGMLDANSGRNKGTLVYNGITSKIKM